MSDVDLTFARALRQHEAGQVPLAERAYEQILKDRPDFAPASHMLGIIALQRGNTDRAIVLFNTAVVENPENHEFRSSLAGGYLASGQHEDAIQNYRVVADARPGDPEAHFNLGFSLAAMGRRGEAMTAYRQAVSVRPDYFNGWNNLGALLLADGRGEEAVACLRRLVELRPEYPSSICNLARALEMCNEIEEASEMVGRALELNPQHAQARLLKATIDRRQGRTEEARRQLVEFLDSKPSELSLVASAFLELGLVLDEKGEYRNAMRVVQQGNAIRRQLPGAYQESKVIYRNIERYQNWFTAERMAVWSNISPDNRQGPVFFVGFPRSGTTLMERMLAAHPDVVTTGERSPLAGVIAALPGLAGDNADYPDFLADLTESQIEAAKEAFWESARSDLGSKVDNMLLVDKSPLNIIELGLVSRVLPSAKVIVALRDPRDVCLSCYMQEFEQNAAMVNFLDVESTVDFYSAVMNLWCHYRDSMFLPFIEYRYEDLVYAPEETLRRVLEFMGLPWAPEMMDYQAIAEDRLVSTPSRDAVTRELTSRAVGRWKNYSYEIKDSLPRLEPFVEAFGYGNESSES